MKLKTKKRREKEEETRLKSMQKEEEKLKTILDCIYTRNRNKMANKKHKNDLWRVKNCGKTLNMRNNTLKVC